MPRLINWNIVSNPANWIIIFAVLYLVALIAKVLFSASQGQTVISLPPGL
jgi:hypothetical protein